MNLYYERIRKKRRAAALYAIGEQVTAFFWDDAPLKYGLEEREGQQDMAFEILDALRHEQHIAVEAGVGIGKSFAYLVPLLLDNEKSFAPTVIATSTIALQEQLMEDVERIKKMLGLQTPVILIKGQAHYLCRRRTDTFLSGMEPQWRSRLTAAMEAGCQDRRDFPFPIPERIWQQINVYRYSRQDCYSCEHSRACEYYQVRMELRSHCGIIICNQDLLTAHLFQLDRGLPGIMRSEVHTVVVDEAHNLEDKIRSATTERLMHRSFIRAIESAVRSVRPSLQEQLLTGVSHAKQAVSQLFENLRLQIHQQIQNTQQDMRYADRFFFRNVDGAFDLIKGAARALRSLSDSVQILTSMSSTDSDSPDSTELEPLAQSLSSLYADLDNRLVWLERSGALVVLVHCPKNTREIIQRLYFTGKIRSIMTSATLTNTTDGTLAEQYAYFIQNTGFPLPPKGRLSEPKPSPFPYDRHAMIYYCDDLPHPTREHDAFISQGVERLIQLLNISQGKAMVLFTSKSDMEEVYAMLQERDLPFQVLMQQRGSSQERVLETFRQDINSVLLGTGSYWEGISIKGKSLSHVVIFRLPFPVPEPIISYKCSVAHDPLMDVLVPEMVMKLKQGIGRLIRNFTDTGMVSIIDPRLRDDPPERYHDIVWRALPIHNRTTDLQEAARFYRAVCAQPVSSS